MFKLFRKLSVKEYILIIVIMVLIFGQVSLDLKMPDYMAEITRLIQSNGAEIGGVLNNGLYMILCAFGSLILSIGIGYLAAYVSSIFSRNIRKDLFYKVGNLGMEEIKKFSTSSLITRMTNDITQVEMFMGMGMMALMKAPLTAFWAISKILNKGFQWTVATGVGVTIVFTTVTLLIVIVIPKFKIVQDLTDKINGITREHIMGIRVVRAFNAEKYQKEKFEEVNNDLTKLQMFNQKSFAILNPIMMLVMYVLTLVIYVIGVNLIEGTTLSGKIEIFGNMIVFSAYAIQVIVSFLIMAFVMLLISRAQVSARRINEVLSCDISVVSGIFDGKSSQIGEIEFKNVSFKYPKANEYVLKDISFKINRGENVAFIGSTGSGKSTLVNLICRFYDVSDGEILVDGIDVKEYEFEKLYEKIGYISQKPFIFEMSIMDNVKIGKNRGEISEKDVSDSLKIAQAKEFVEKMEEGYNSLLSRDGTNISGGQKQRISIARAIAGKPEIYIFDDSFSALDFKTEANLKKELGAFTKGSTILEVASRIGSVMNSDRIIVLENGRIVGMGKHDELLDNCEVYQEIAYSQLSKEEV